MKKILISMIALLMVIMPINVMAATTGSITLSSSTSTIKAKDEFTVVVKASDSNNLNTVEYSNITITDKNGKETSAITLEKIESIGDWAKMNNDGNTAFVYSGSATQTQDVFKLTFKVSDKIAAGTYNINVNGLIVYSTNLLDDTTTVGTKTVSVKVEEEKVLEENKNNVANNTGNKVTNNNANNNGSKLPQTGIEDVPVFVVIILGIVSIISYVSYKRYRDI